jgi:hypothetical protein
MKDKSQIFYLSQAGFTLKIVFEPTDQIFIKNEFISIFKKTWKDFLTKKGKKEDFSITVSPGTANLEVIAREAGEKYYFLSISRDFKHNKATIYYSGSIRILDTLIKEVFAYLLAKDGFLLHSSTLLGQDKTLYIFLARSGGGKTTTAKLLRGKALTEFSDDIVIVKRTQEGWRYFTPPLVEKERPALRQEAKKAVFFVIKKAKKGYKRKIENPGKILPFLLGQIWLREQKVDKRIFANAVKLIRENRFYYLGVTLERRVMKGIISEN